LDKSGGGGGGANITKAVISERNLSGQLIALLPTYFRIVT